MYVTIKGSIKDLFDPAHKPAALKALTDGIRDALDGHKEFDTRKSEKLALLLTVSASVSADDDTNPTKLKASVTVDGTLTGATGQAFRAAGNATMSGVRPNKLEREASDLIGMVVADLMKGKVVPQMLKLAP